MGQAIRNSTTYPEGGVFEISARHNYRVDMHVSARYTPNSVYYDCSQPGRRYYRIYQIFDFPELWIFRLRPAGSKPRTRTCPEEVGSIGVFRSLDFRLWTFDFPAYRYFAYSSIFVFSLFSRNSFPPWRASSTCFES